MSLTTQSFTGIIIYDGVLQSEGSEGSSINIRDLGYLLLMYIWIHVARIISISILYFPLKRTGYGITFKDTIILCIGGLRGVIGLALALLTQLEPLSMAAEKEKAFKYQMYVEMISKYI